MTYNFDEKTYRKNTNSSKHDGLKRYFGYDDLQALWVADMDFKTPNFINDKIIEATQNSIYGYSIDNDKLYDSIISWQKNRHSWNIEKNDIYMINGVVPAYSACIEAFSEEGDEIIVQTPIYRPLFKSVKANNRVLVENPLKQKDDYYTMDLEDLESKINSKTKILCLCSPHNPVGRVWTKEELVNLANICIKHNITIISDEIHSDITFKKFTPLASISEKIANISLTLNSAGKTFNIAGLNCGYAISKNHNLLNKFKIIANKREIQSINFFGYIATQAAYENGSFYVDELNKYLMENIKFTQDYLREHNLKISFKKPEATYLLWLNFKSTNYSHEEINNILLENAKLALNNGISFGKNGDCYFRLNIALRKEELILALNKLNSSFSNTI